MVSLLVFLLGAWGGVVAFVGPAFGFSADGSTSWTWSKAHEVLWLAPGAAACGSALLIVVWTRRVHRGLGRLGVAGAGLMVAASGAWFAVGPVAWPVLQRSAGVFVPAAPLRELSYLVGYSLGPAVLLCLLGGLVLGWAWRGEGLPMSLGRRTPLFSG
jgi:hypothetical protein